MHDALAGAKPRVIHLIHARVLAKRRHEPTRSHPLHLHAQDVHDVGICDVTDIG
jgi:hypothetical protein